MKRVIQNRFKAGLIAFTLLAAQLIVPVQPVFATHRDGEVHGPGAPANNAGDIKVIETGMTNEIPNNDPQLESCSVTVEFYNFNNTTNLNSTVSFTSQSPTSDALIQVLGASTSPVIVGDGDADGQGNNDLDGSFAYTLAFTGEPAQKGYHVDLDVDVAGTVGGSKQKMFWMPASCRTLSSVTPQQPSSIDQCATSKDTYTIPMTPGVDYLVNGVKVGAGTYGSNGATSIVVTAAAQAGFTLSNYTGPWTLSFPDSSACEAPKTPVTPTAVTFEDKCGINNDKFSVPAKDGVDYYVDGNLTAAGTYSGVGKVTVEAMARDGFILTDSTSSWSYEFTNEQCPRIPTQCTVSNTTYDRVWQYKGVSQPMSGPMQAGLAGSFDFQDEGLYINTPVKESYVTGFFDGGDTPLVDVDAMGYKVLRQEKSAGVPVTLPAYILSVDTNGLDVAGGQTYFFYEPYYNDGARAAIEGTFQTWDAYMNGDAKWYRSGTNQKIESWKSLVAQFPDAVVLAHGFNQGTYNAETYAVVQDIVFDCATISFRYFQGMGGGETPTTPVKPVVPVVETIQGQGAAGQLPAELPMTGAGGTISTWFALLAAVLTYGAVLFLQPKKRLEE